MTTQRPLPGFVRERLIDEGHMDRRGLTHKVQTRRCRRCGTTCRAAYDSSACEAWADARAVDPAGELAALLDDRRTWHIAGDELVRRNAWLIAGRPASTFAVFVEHFCSRPIPRQWLAAIPPGRKADTDPDNPPF